MQRNFIYSGGASKRFHTVETLTIQDIASHSFGVAWFCEIITSKKASKNLIMAALSHDLAEHIVGDIPSPAKRLMNISNLFQEMEADLLKTAGLTYAEELTEGEKFTLHLSDMLEGMMYCIRERKLGNRNIDICYGRFRAYAMELIRLQATVEAAASWSFDKQVVEDIMYDIETEWKEAKQ